MGKRSISVDQYGHQSVARTTTDTNIGAAAQGDYLDRVIVQVAPTVDNLTISDGGTAVLIIPTTAAIGAIYEVGAVADVGWQVDLHATGVGTITAIGEF